MMRGGYRSRFSSDPSMRTLASMGMAWLFFQSQSTAFLVKTIRFAYLCSERRLLRMLNRIKVCCPFGVVDCKCNVICQTDRGSQVSRAMMSHEDHFFQSDVLMAAYLHNSPLKSHLTVGLNYLQ